MRDLVHELLATEAPLEKTIELTTWLVVTGCHEFVHALRWRVDRVAVQDVRHCASPFRGGWLVRWLGFRRRSAGARPRPVVSAVLTSPWHRALPGRQRR